MSKGTTSKQMKEAPLNSIYIWCNEQTLYPIRLATALGRHDLLIVTPRWLNAKSSFLGSVRQGITIDHATEFSQDQLTHLYRLFQLVVPYEDKHLLVTSVDGEVTQKKLAESIKQMGNPYAKLGAIVEEDEHDSR